MTQNKFSTSKTRYFLYARKSTESEDRQVQSIDDQINRLKRLASEMGLQIVSVLTESKSAKKPNNRPVFDDMMKRVQQGEADGILCWQINRLSRNPIDSGQLSWLLQQGVLKSIQTIDKQYLPDDNVLIFSVESGAANQFILDLSKNTKRGLQSKLEKGWRTGPAAQGYLNDLVNKTIVKDPERFLLIRKIWDYMLTGNYTPPMILDMLNNQWGYRTRKSKRLGDKPMSRSCIYRLLSNIFYTGIVEVNGKQYQGKHEPMVTLEEFDRVQILLGKKGKPRPKKHKFAFTGAIRCAVCGCLYTAETKTKLIKETGQLKDFTYYHCTRKTKRVVCDQKKGVEVSKLEEMIEKEITQYTILPQFLHWALEKLNRDNDNEIETRTKTYEMQHLNLATAQNELDELTRMRYRQLIDDDIFLKEKPLLENKITQMKQALRQTEDRAEKWLELSERTFCFATYALNQFVKADSKEGLELKKEILLGLGETVVIQDKKLILEPKEWFVPIKNKYPALEAEYKRLEPEKNTMDKVKTEALTSVRTNWLRSSDSNREPSR